MNEARQTEGTRPSVLAIGVTPHQALQAHRTLLGLFPEVDLLAPDDPTSRERYSGFTPRFRFVELDRRDQIEAQLLASYAAYNRRVADLLSRSPRESTHFVDPFSALVVAVTLAAAERQARRPWHRFMRGRHADERSALALLLRGLGLAYEGGFPGPVLLEILDARVTLLAQPGLPAEAVELAERLVRVPGQDASQRPLRWNGDLRQWIPMSPDWADQGALRAVATEMQEKLPPDGGD